LKKLVESTIIVAYIDKANEGGIVLLRRVSQPPQVDREVWFE